MNMTIRSHVRRSLSRGLILAAGIAAGLPAAEITGLKLGGAGWFNYGRIGKSSIDTTGGIDIDGKAMLNSGAQVALHYTVSEKLQVEAGVGSASFHFISANFFREGGYAPMLVAPYVANANFTYSFWNEDDGALQVRGGLFPYDYAPDAQNLGLYLLRGPVYPGYLISGFETKHVLPVANTLGLQVRHRSGGFTQDALLNVETEFYPFYDISPAYLASFQAGEAFRIGGGINFYHLLSVESKLTQDSINFFVDTTGVTPDTVQLSFSGIKVGANFSFDPKALFGAGGMGPEDLKLYGEVALIGLNNSSAYKQIYGDYKNRMPVMVGFNIPTFKILDRLAVEVEWYGAKFTDNPEEFDHTAGNTDITSIPFNPDPSKEQNVTKDDLKWSLYGSRVMLNHIKLSFQVANDHFRPGLFQGYGDNRPADMMSVMQGGGDWYWMSKVTYFF